jgi:16S rRNA (adenine1518-N6/adenine1519-N6)-dimethyltransferase
VTLSEIRQVLERRGIVLTKSLGQNFLHDKNQLQRIADAAELHPSDNVLEIGPGLGPLTEVLLERSGHVLAIEKDARLVEVLKERFASTLSDSPPGPSKLSLLHEDALDHVRARRVWRDWKLVSNLPYSVASPILVELASSEQPPERMVATLQIEVAKRLMAGADDSDYGVLTLLVQRNFEPGGWFKIPSTCFFPEPDVDSACVTLVRRSTPVVDPAGSGIFVRVVKRSFSQRRKMMLKLLRQDWTEPALLEGFKQAGIAVTERAEKVSLEQFACLSKFLGKSVKKDDRRTF